MNYPSESHVSTDSAVSESPSTNLGRSSRQFRRSRIVACLIGTYLLLSYFLIPLVWKGVEWRNGRNDDRPQITHTSDGHPGDPINVRLVGSQSELVHAMALSGWYQADKLGIRSDLAIGADTLLDRTYADAPVSHLYLFGRSEDLAFEQPLKTNPRHRHHVRFWKTNQLDDDGRTVWLGSASFDKSVGFSHTTGQITHHIAIDVDIERDYLAESLKRTNAISDEDLQAGFHDQLHGFNGGGDPWTTDGALWKATIRSTSNPNLGTGSES